MRPRSVAVWAALPPPSLSASPPAATTDNDSGGGSGSTGSKNLTIYSSLPLQGDSRPQSEDVVNGEKLALEQAAARSATTRSSTCRSTTPPRGRQVGAGPDVGRTPARLSQDELDDRLPRRVQLRRVGDLDPDHQRGRASCRSSPSNTALGLTRPGGAEQGRAGQVLPDRQAHLRPRRPADHIQGAAQAPYHEGEASPSSTSSTTRRSTARASPTHTQKAAEELGHQGRSATTASTPRRRTTARWRPRSRSTGADAVFFGGITQNNGRPGLQGRQRRATRTQAVRPRRRRRVAVHREDPARAIAEAHVHHGADARPEGATRRRRRSSSRTSRPSTARIRSRTPIYGYEAMAVVARRDQARGRQGQRPPGRHRRSSSRRRAASRCSARTTSTRTATPRSPTTARHRIEGGKLVFDKVIKAQHVVSSATASPRRAGTSGPAAT